MGLAARPATASTSQPKKPIPLRSTSATEPLTFVRRRWVGLSLFLTDTMVLQLSLGLGFLVRLALRSWIPIGMSWEQYHVLVPLMMTVPLGSLLAGLYPGYGLGPVARLRRRTIVLVVLMTVLILWQSEMLNFFVAGFRFPRLAILATMLFAMVLCPLAEALLIWALVQKRMWGTPVVVIGSPETTMRVIRSLKKVHALGWVPVGAFCDELAGRCERVEDVPLLGAVGRTRAWSGKVRIAVLAPSPNGNGPHVSLASRLRFDRVVIVPDLKGLPTLGVHARDLGGLASLEIPRNLLKTHNWIFKRMLDYAVCVPLFVLSLPILGVLALWIKRSGPGPALFRQERIGLAGRKIRIWKLRTMHVDAEQRLEAYLQQNPQAREEWDCFCKLKQDPRVLPGVGRFLRRTSLDELPQLWNILVGDMSLVGPRPFPAYHTAKFSRDFRALRQRVWPGLTGLWQISERSEGDIEVQQSQDTYYVQNWSLWLDVYIVSRTLGALCMGKGAY